MGLLAARRAVKRDRTSAAMSSATKRNMPWRLAVDDIARGACKLSVTIRSFSSAPPATSLNHLKPFKLSTALMAVHKHCYAPIGLIQQGGPRREGNMSQFFLTQIERRVVVRLGPSDRVN